VQKLWSSPLKTLHTLIICFNSVSHTRRQQVGPQVDKQWSLRMKRVPRKSRYWFIDEINDEQ
jgi:hypothetical protein